MLTFYHIWGSTCSRKVRITLLEKGAEWEDRLVSLPELENWEPWYVKINPRGVVPAIDHDGRIVVESTVIIQYLEDVFGAPPLRPVDPWERAKMRLWIDKSEHVVHKNIHVISAGAFHAKRWPAYIERHSREELREKIASQPDRARARDELRHFDHGVTDEERDFAIARIVDELDVMEEDLERGPWLTGETFSLADIAIVPFIERFETNGLGEHIAPAVRPRLAEWYERIMARQSVVKAYDVPQP